jgi:hypothetical protein
MPSPQRRAQPALKASNGMPAFKARGRRKPYVVIFSAYWLEATSISKWTYGPMYLDSATRGFSMPRDGIERLRPSIVEPGIAQGESFINVKTASIRQEKI